MSSGATAEASFRRARGRGQDLARTVQLTLLRVFVDLFAVVVRDDQPVNLASAFERPVPDTDPSGAACGVAAESAGRLAREYLRSVRQWGDEPAHAAVSHAFDGTADDEITRAFGDNQPFDQMLQSLDQALARTWQS